MAYKFQIGTAALSGSVELLGASGASLSASAGVTGSAILTDGRVKAGTLSASGVSKFVGNAQFGGTLAISGALSTRTDLSGGGLVKLVGDAQFGGSIASTGSVMVTGSVNSATGVSGASGLFTGRLKAAALEGDGALITGISADKSDKITESNITSSKETGGGHLKAGINWVTQSMATDATVILPSGNVSMLGTRVVVKAAQFSSSIKLVVSAAGAHRIDRTTTTVNIDSEYAAISFILVRAPTHVDAEKEWVIV